MWSSRFVPVAGLVCALVACSDAADSRDSAVDGGAGDAATFFDGPDTRDDSVSSDERASPVDVPSVDAVDGATHADVTPASDSGMSAGVDATIGGTRFEFAVSRCAVVPASADMQIFYLLVGSVSAGSGPYANLSISLPTVAVGTYPCARSIGSMAPVAVTVSGNAPAGGTTPQYDDRAHCEVVVSSTCSGPGEGSIVGAVHHGLATRYDTGETRTVEATFSVPCHTEGFVCP